MYQMFKLIQQSGVMALESHFEKPDEEPDSRALPEVPGRHESVDFLADSAR